jgi:CheY-like chemotaxis protein
MSTYAPGKCPVLYVDDSSDDRFFFQRSALQTQTPFHIQPCFCADAALAYLIGEAPFDDRLFYPWPAFILCDYDLGTSTGSDLVSDIRALPSCRALPIVIFSGVGGNDCVVKCYAAGADHFLRKPSTPDRLNIIVQTLYACATSAAGCFDALKRLEEYQRDAQQPTRQRSQLQTVAKATKAEMTKVEC